MSENKKSPSPNPNPKPIISFKPPANHDNDKWWLLLAGIGIVVSILMILFR